ncbi:MAG: 50S ribosomal protein L2 [Candidatus Omnitrophica bacterium CG07_land_8_20_14_0_80_42_15]|uniref:Large ribosomal subunit protein uL2 n=1 Tax=Candidatus Aquitaenariimonas noxiae TaxID=1974741 RepID=A0A2J0L799_9BACT|nr:MAG: 50S ribosomal protein L2 [Candidatus Omnitrophica bacterium CG07_land_8_20_14_0_80_42_15]
MALKSFRPTTPSRRFYTVSSFDEITKNKPEKSLTKILKKTGGRNSYGRITSRGIGGGHKQKFRIIDFKRDKFNIPGKVIAIEYDPTRTARIALIQYEDKEKRYIIAPIDLKVGDEVMSSPNAEIKAGNAMPLGSIPPGIPIHNIELYKGKGGQIVRSAGGMAQILAKEGGFAHVRLPSGEVRLINLNCLATIGQVGNIEHENISLGNAGRSRHLGRNPLSRAVAKNPHDHPMGGGEGKSSGGRHPTTPWGKITKGLKTRKRKSSDKYIIKRRTKGE